ncbi:MAG: hypothetical protein RR977_05090, partial [Oscillospiraceae bacterium]
IPSMLQVLPLGMREPNVFEYSLEAEHDADIRRDLFQTLSQNEFPLLGLKSSELTLEDIFLQLTAGDVQEIRVEDIHPMVGDLSDEIAKSDAEEVFHTEKNNGGEE